MSKLEKISEQKINDIVSTYINENISIQKVADKLDVSLATAYKYIKLANLETSHDSRSYNHAWTKEEDKIIIDNWAKAESIGDICKLLKNRSEGTINFRGKKLGLMPRSINYYKNDSFFSVPNNSNSYWAGMISTDGCFILAKPGYNGGYGIKLELKSSDCSHIEKLKKEVESNYKIYHKKFDEMKKMPGYDAPRLMHVDMGGIHFGKAKQWILDLNKHWGIPFKGKTFGMKRPNLTNFEHKLAYIKGLIDGDGSIFISQVSRYSYLFINFIGTNDLLNWIKETLDEIFAKMDRENTRIVLKKGNIYTYRVTGLDACLLFYLLKRINTPELERKWTNIEILSFVQKQKDENINLFKIVDNLDFSPPPPTI